MSKLFNLDCAEEVELELGVAKITHVIDDEEWTDCIIEVMTRIMKEQGIEPKRGDIVAMAVMYRNDGRYIWDGKVLLSLDTEFDEYGNVPQEFKWPEFPLNHWDKTIDHNTIRWIELEKLHHAEDVYDFVPYDECDDYNYHSDWTTFFEDDNGEWVEYVIQDNN